MGAQPALRYFFPLISGALFTVSSMRGDVLKPTMVLSLGAMTVSDLLEKVTLSRRITDLGLPIKCFNLSWCGLVVSACAAMGGLACPLLCSAGANNRVRPQAMASLYSLLWG